VTRSTTRPDAATPVSETPTLGNILLPRDRASALAFVNGMLAAYDNFAVGEPLRRSDVLAVRQYYLDMPVEA
jgi:hypothetical protein